MANWPECPRCFWKMHQADDRLKTMPFESWWNQTWPHAKERKICSAHEIEMAAFLLRLDGVA